MHTGRSHTQPGKALEALTRCISQAAKRSLQGYIWHAGKLNGKNWSMLIHAYLRQVEKAASAKQVMCVEHEVPEGAIWGLGQAGAARLQLALSRRGHPSPLVIHHKGVQGGMLAHRHRLVKAL